MQLSENVNDGYEFFDSEAHPSHVLVNLPKVEAAFPLQRVLFRLVTPPTRPLSQGAIICQLVPDAGFPDELPTRVPVPVGDHNNVGRPVVPVEVVDVPHRFECCPHVVTATNLRVAPERGFP